MTMKIVPLGDRYGFGSVVTGIGPAMLDDQAVRDELKALFEDRGLILFRGVEGHDMQLALSTIFGPLKDHPVASVKRAEGQPSIIDMRYDPEEGTLFEMEGREVAHWLPWHFDHCYNDTLNRGGVLRPVEIAAQAGETGFLDGIEAYDALSDDLRRKIADLNVVYRMELYMTMPFGRPAGYKVVHVPDYARVVMEDAGRLPRAIHPMVFQRTSDGRRVLNLSPWMAEGIEGHEDAAGAALLEEVIAAMIAGARPYFHSWRADDMIAWDNWRMLHSVSGHPKDQPRRMQRTTIMGDYGLGRFEDGAQGGAVLEMTV